MGVWAVKVMGRSAFASSDCLQIQCCRAVPFAIRLSHRPGDPWTATSTFGLPPIEIQQREVEEKEKEDKVDGTFRLWPGPEMPRFSFDVTGVHQFEYVLYSA